MANDSVKCALRFSLASVICMVGVVLLAWFPRAAAEFVCARAGAPVGWATPVTFIFLLAIVLGLCWLAPIQIWIHPVRYYVRLVTVSGFVAAAIMLVGMLGTVVGILVAAGVVVFAHVHLSEDSRRLVAMPFSLVALFTALVAFARWQNKRGRIVRAASRWINGGVEMSAQEQEARMDPFLVFARQGAARIDASTGHTVLEYGPALKGAALTVAIAIPLEIVVIGVNGYFFLPTNDVFLVWMFVGMAGFVAFMGTLLLATLNVKVTLSPEGIGRCSPWRRGQHFIKWEDVREVECQKMGKDFTIISNDGTKIRVNLYLTGILALVDAFRAHLPSEKLSVRR